MKLATRGSSSTTSNLMTGESRSGGCRMPPLVRQYPFFAKALILEKLESLARAMKEPFCERPGHHGVSHPRPVRIIGEVRGLAGRDGVA
jgi:hypothetical protein